MSDSPPHGLPRKLTPRGGMSPRNQETIVVGEQNTLKGAIARAKQSDACLLVVHGTPIGHRYVLKDDLMVVGRDPSVGVCLPDQSVSRRHCQIAREAGAWKLTDLGGPNGTYVNDVKISKDNVVLQKDALIKLGNTLLKFVPTGETESLVFGSLSSAANFDALTKVMNKARFLSTLDTQLKACEEEDDMCLMFLDLDNFKKINDGNDHLTGDFVLKYFAEFVSANHLRPSDTFARYGGDEFVLLLPKTKIEEAISIAETIRAGVESADIVYEGKTKIALTVSIGVAELTETMETGQQLIKAADLALYSAKGAGKNKVVAKEKK